MKKLMISLCLFLTLGVSQSNAGLLLEPYVGYQIGGWDKSVVSGMNFIESESTGLGFGARVGFQTFGLMLGGVYETFPSLSDGYGDNGEQTRMGVFAGYDFPLFVRVWGSYFLDISGKIGSGGEFSDGLDNALSVGAGLTFLPLVSLNVEYRMFGMGTQRIGNTDVDMSDLEYNEIFLSVSLPLNL